MVGKFQWQKFSEIDLNDAFFDSLKLDYRDFIDWYHKKQYNKENALVYNDEFGIGAFLYLKRETEEIKLENEVLPSVNRLKIGTLRLAERIRRQRLGEGALGVALWYWREIQVDEIYVTVFEKHKELINLFERFGFTCVGLNPRGECIYLKRRNELNYKDAYTCFPFVSSHFNNAGLLPINDEYHDRLFPYSELAGTQREIIEITAGNGITKVFIATPFNSVQYQVGMPVFVYRKHTGSGQKAYKSVVTSFCTISKLDIIKENYAANTTLDDFLKKVGNKSVYSQQELNVLYKEKRNLILIELVYNGYFGKGHNVTYKELKEKGLFDVYPYDIQYNQQQFIQILEMGDVDVQNTIIN